MKLAHVPWAGSAAPDEADLRQRLERDGFDVMRWSDPPGRVYEPHQHPHDESLWGLEGEIVFAIAGATYALGPGDRILLPRGTVHAATVGAAGATYLIGHR